MQHTHGRTVSGPVVIVRPQRGLTALAAKPHCSSASRRRSVLISSANSALPLTPVHTAMMLGAFRIPRCCWLFGHIGVKSGHEWGVLRNSSAYHGQWCRTFKARQKKVLRVGR